jgi:predicted RNA-binding Zn ribbon-like protein
MLYGCNSDLPTVPMHETQPSPPLLGDSRGLDFVNTRWTPGDVEIEGLASGEGFMSWLKSAWLISAAVIDEVRSIANPGELDSVAAQARALREWFRGFVAKHRGRPLMRKAVSELEPLNRLLARDEEFSQLVSRPKASDEDVSPFELVVLRRWRSPDALLFPLAKTLAELVATADFADVKHCEGHACTLHFVDTTRDRRRRWCSMAVCGNRAKQAKLRDRRATN